ncbi:MAG: hypothetical protein IJ600_03595 [Lachnospiraceae bacterium]|nr:hypothetical protein [Lachnospiraceae bacterium]
MCDKKRWLAIGLGVMLGLSACGSTEESSRGRKPEAEEEQEQPEQPQEKPAESTDTQGAGEQTAQPAADGVFAEAFAKGEVENNGGYFVRIGDKVYYRVYGERGLHRTALFGDFLSGDVAEAASEIKSYDLQTGKVESVGTVYGSGGLYAGVDGFFLSDGEWKETSLFILGETEQAVYCEGALQGVSADGQGQLFMRITEDFDIEYVLYRAGKEVSVLGKESEDALYFCGFAGNDAIGVRRKSDDPEWTLFSLDPDGVETELGKMLPDTEDPYFSSLMPEPEQLLCDEKGAYLTFGYYDGTGHFLQCWQAVSVQPGVSGSLQELDKGGAGESDSVPKMFLTAPGEVEFAENVAGEVGLSEGYYGDLVYFDSPYGATLLKKDMLPEEEAKGEVSWENFLLDAVAFDDTAFLITAYGTRNELQDIGWREAYDLVYMEFSAIPFGEGHLEDGMPKETVSLEFLTSTGWAEGAVDFADLTGSWKLYYYETEGAGDYVEENETDMRLVIEADQHAYLEETVDGNKERTDLTYDGSQGGASFYTNEGMGDDVMQLDVLSCDGSQLEVSVSWWYSDGTPGGSSWVFTKE